jgi:hypothetical protein
VRSKYAYPDRNSSTDGLSMIGTNRAAAFNSDEK